MSTRTELYEGALILTDKGPRIVVGLTPTSFVTRGIDGGIEEIDWREVESAREIFEGRVEAVSYSATASWEGLGTDAKEQALDRQEVVLEILTGYARGHAALAALRN